MWPVNCWINALRTSLLSLVCTCIVERFLYSTGIVTNDLSCSFALNWIYGFHHNWAFEYSDLNIISHESNGKEVKILQHSGWWYTSIQPILWIHNVLVWWILLVSLAHKLTSTQLYNNIIILNYSLRKWNHFRWYEPSCLKNSQSRKFCSLN